MIRLAFFLLGVVEAVLRDSSQQMLHQKLHYTMYSLEVMIPPTRLPECIVLSKDDWC